VGQEEAAVTENILLDSAVWMTLALMLASYVLSRCSERAKDWTFWGSIFSRYKRRALLQNNQCVTLQPTQSPVQWVSASLPGVKRPGPSADHSPACSSEGKNEWNNTSTSLYAFVAWTGWFSRFIGVYTHLMPEDRDTELLERRVWFLWGRWEMSVTTDVFSSSRRCVVAGMQVCRP
jgi:hypothetical protein